MVRPVEKRGVTEILRGESLIRRCNMAYALAPSIGTIEMFWDGAADGGSADIIIG